MGIFEIWTTEEDTATDYVLHGYGEIEKYNDPDDEKLKAEEENDNITRFPDGSYILVGSTGNMYGDAYRLSEKPYKFERYSGDGAFSLKWNGEDVTDEVAENKVRPGKGLSGLINRDTLYEIIDARVKEMEGDSGNSDSEEPVNHYYGGGNGYPRGIPAGDADYYVSTLDELIAASVDASSGDVVFVDGDAEIYMGSERAVFDDGVTVASDRGVDGSKGALLHTDDGYDAWASQGVVKVGDGGRVSGLRVRGPLHDRDWQEYNGKYYSSGIELGADGECDNCEVWGFNHLIHLNGDDCHVHHAKLYKANMKGVGYVIAAVGTEGLLMEWCHTYHFRHVVGATGDGGFEARFNIIDGPALAHVYDQHAPGGTYTHVHHNTCRVGDDVASGDPYVPFMTFRGENVQNGEVYNNWVHNPREARDDPAGFTDEWLTRAYDGGADWEGIESWNNHLGETEPDDSDVGAPQPHPPNLASN